jgi:hypothetical protein
MLTARLQARVPSAVPVGTGRLNGHELRFHKRSRDGSGKCNVVPSSADGAHVYGVLFDVSSSVLRPLDEAEQRGHGYERADVVVHRGPSASTEAFAYVAQPAYVDDALLPYNWYRALVLAGAREHALPAPYVAQIEAVSAYPDPDSERRCHHQRLLRKNGVPLLSR